jgi:D-alanyl-lipoteichoic acid acyltransferase DltB (MBOAT superfamily)
MGITIPSNFDSPYQSKSITEFWRRWHISLSNWLRDYLYIFWLGGNRKGKLRTYVNLLITMLLGGFWHGAKWTFIVWGGLHGLALIVHKLWAARTAKTLATVNNTPWYNAVAAFVTFLFVCFCWIFFRADNFDIAASMIRQIGTNLSFDAAIVSGFWGNYKPVVWMMLLGYALHLIPQRVPDYITVRFIERTPLLGYLIASLVFVYAYAQVKSATPVMPIYLQF